MLERSVSVRTPEAIAFYYELAGLGSRFLALLIDMVIQITAAIVLFIVAVQGAASAAALAKLIHLSEKALASTVFAVGILLFFVLFYGYFVIFEKLWNGQTPGKRLLGIRVVRDGGYPVELVGSIIRNLVRIIEQILGFYVISVVSMLLSPENKRLGDYAAGTIVVRDRGFEVRDPKDWLRPGAGEATSADNRRISNLSPDELALVDKYVARKTGLDPRSARDAAAKIASALRPKLDPEFAALPDDELLMKIATRVATRE
jgi:uncharacterized RDD family membrane protein YckC